MWRCCFLLFCLASSACRQTDQPTTVNLFVAASMAEVMERAAEDYQTQTGVVVRVNGAASSVLARQIDSGAPADLYLSANREWADWLARRQTPVGRVDLAANRLVLLSHQAFDLRQPPPGLITLGDPEHVPAGAYAREALMELGWFAPMQKRLIPANDVRAALRLWLAGEADHAVVYASDTLGIDAHRFTIDEDLHQPIRYPLLQLSDRPEVTDLFQMLQSQATQDLLEAAGFQRILD